MTTPAEECPVCARTKLTVGTMELRFNTKGVAAFTPFFGCSRWPVCTHTRAFNHNTDEPALRSKMPSKTYRGFVRAFDGSRSGEVFWVEGMGLPGTMSRWVPIPGCPGLFREVDETGTPVSFEVRTAQELKTPRPKTSVPRKTHRIGSGGAHDPNDKERDR